ncbi:MAG: DUF4114 domain-containing protein, partial [Bacteroidota bacterium]
MKKLSIAGLLMLLSLLLFHCQEDMGPDDEINQYEKYSKKGNLLINNDPAGLSSRIEYKDQLVSIKDVEKDEMLKSGGGSPQVDHSKNYAFNLKAEVAPPEYKDSTMQATHVTIKDDYAFVTYNFKGPAWLGGIDIFNVADREDPQLIAQIITPEADINSVDFYDEKIYIVGATGDHKERGYGSPAFLEVIRAPENMNSEDIEIDTILDLDSYTGTDVRVTDDKIYATSGSDGDLSIFSRSGYTELGTEELDHARSVDANSDDLFVLQGQEGRINRFNLEDGSYKETYEVGGATIEGSKSEIAVSDDYIFAALNDGGLSMLNTDGSEKQSIPKPDAPTDGVDSNYVTNSVSLNGDLVLIGNGGAGVYVGGIIPEENDSLWMMGNMQFDGPESTNFVESEDSVIFVASGKGGLKIIDISIDHGVPDDVVPTEPCETLIDEISDLFPEEKDVRDMHDDLFSDTARSNIRVKEETPVYVTFIDEKASWKNTFGYYTYHEDDPPESLDELEKHVIFPNVSKEGEGGGLEFGDQVQLGDEPFPEGTVIGFYLVAQGWKNGETVEGKYTHYTNKAFNENQAQQSSLFLSSSCNDLVLTFEDIKVGTSRCDHDFNDIIFTV